jgi:tetratricopeptide (TPR) repeat protein
MVLGGVVVLPGALNRFVFPKLAVTLAGVSVAARAPARGRLPRLVWALLGAAVAVLAAAALMGADPLQQLVGVAPRYEGLLTIGLYLGAGVTGARLLGPDRPRETDALLVRLLSPFESNVSRAGSLLGNASDQGAWAVLALGPLLLTAVRAPSRLVVGGAAAAALAIVLSGSRGALLGAVAVLVLLLVVVSGRRARLSLAAAGCGMAVLAVALPAVRGRVLGEGQAADTVAGRGLLWRESWRLFLEHPVLGVGPGGFGEAIRGVHGSAWYAALGTANPPDSPHDWLLQALLAGGPILLVLVLVLVSLTARAAWSRLAAASLFTGLAAGLAGYAVALLFHFTGPGHTPLAALFTGALLAQSAGRELANAALDRVVAVAVGALAAVVTFGAVAELPQRAAVVRVARGDASGADDYFDTARTFRPWDPAIAATAGHAFAVAGNASNDADELERAERWLSSARRSASVLVYLGKVREARGDFPGAAAALDDALRRDPADPDALLLRGIVAARSEQWADAEAFFVAAARSAPKSPAPWENLARVRAAAGDSAGAAAARRKAAEIRK